MVRRYGQLVDDEGNPDRYIEAVIQGADPKGIAEVAAGEDLMSEQAVTKQVFDFMASVINSMSGADKEGAIKLAIEVGEKFNPRFDKARFMQAVGR